MCNDYRHHNAATPSTYQHNRRSDGHTNEFDNVRVFEFHHDASLLTEVLLTLRRHLTAVQSLDSNRHLYNKKSQMGI